MKNKQDSLAILESSRIRRQYDEKKEMWYFSVIDIIAALTEQNDYNKAKSYWTTLKNRLKNEGSDLRMGIYFRIKKICSKLPVVIFYK